MSLEGTTIPIIATLAGTGWVDLWMEYSSLNESVVVMADPQVTLAGATVAQISEVAARMVILHARSEDLVAYSAAVQGVVPVIPRWANDKIGLDFAPAFQGR